MKLKQTLIVSIIMLITSICLPYLNSSEDKELKKSFGEFPMKIGQWRGSVSRFDQKVYDVLGVDDSLLANYHNPDKGEIQLYIGYYKSQREGEIIHSPKNCMPGSGWNIVESSLVNLKTKKEHSANVIKLVLQKGLERQILFYWFHSRGRVISSEYAQKIYLIWDSITKHRTDGCFVRILSPVMDRDELKTTQRLKQFSEQLFPILNEFIPT